MKILRVISHMNPTGGGPCQGIRNSVPELAKLGAQNEVVSLDDPAAPYLERDPFIIHAMGPGHGPWCYSNKMVPWLTQNLQRFDVVIVHGLWLYHSFAVYQAIYQLKKQQKGQKVDQVKIPKFYVMPHGMLDPYFQKSRERRFKALRNIIYWELLEKKVISAADGLLFTCETELKLARQTFSSYRPLREINVGYGIESPPAPKQKRGTLKNTTPDMASPPKPYLLFIGRIHQKKGIEILLKAYEAFLQETHQKDIFFPRLIIAGPGTETPFGRKMQLLVMNSASLKAAVTFPGMLSGDKKWRALYECEAFILPSHQENFGIAVVEAMACGKPVLISGQVNIWQEIEAEGGGLFMEDSVEGILQVLKSWNSTSIEERQLMGEKALKCFKKRFSAGPAARQFLEAVS